MSSIESTKIVVVEDKRVWEGQLCNKKLELGPVGPMIGGVWVIVIIFKCRCGVGKKKKHRLPFEFKITTPLEINFAKRQHSTLFL